MKMQSRRTPSASGTLVVAVVLFSLLHTSAAAPSRENEWRLQSLFTKMMGLPDEASNSGVLCAGCTIVTGLVEQLTQINGVEVFDELCDFIPAAWPELRKECDLLAKIFGPSILKMIDNGETADVICHQLLLCSNATCHLFPKPQDFPNAKADYQIPPQVLQFQRPSTLGQWEWPWERVAEHKPAFDDDQDLFSTYQTLRGWSFRGADCNDQDATVYPGRKESNSPDTVDFNCNGISGHDANGKSYEDLYCKDYPPYGTIILGDSAGAHFHIPPSWITATQMNSDQFLDLLSVAENEGDWPMMSSATGYQNVTWVGHPQGPVDSGYLRGRQRNLCAHRDYQNLGVNGARSSSMKSSIMQTLSRNSTTDFPAFVSYALIGNDVCNPHFGLSHMTTPAEFYQNVVDAMDFLEERLPPKSHVALIGLVDGRVLYDTMGERIHPIGAYNNNVRYKDFYDFLNCLQISPCFGWMNSDAFWRNATTARAMELNAQYQKIVKEKKYTNFDMVYYDCPLAEVITTWKQQGGQTWELIEPVDGFHPNQISNALTTEVMWPKYERDGLLGAINPNNAQIKSLFGDQGGYAP